MKRHSQKFHFTWITERIALPLVIIVLFIAQEVTMLIRSGMPPTYRGYLIYILEVATFFVSLLWVAPLAFKAGKRLFFLFRLLFIVAIHHLVRCMLAFKTADHSDFLDFMLSTDRWILTAWRLDYSLGISFFIALVYCMAERKVALKEAQLMAAKALEEKARIESTMAQMQLSPHLLLGGLAYIQTYIKGKVPEVVEAIQLMREMLMHSLVNVNAVKLVPVADAAVQINNRVAFQQMLYNKQLCVSFNADIEEARGSLCLPPSLLMPLAENLLKYGQLDDPEGPASIVLRVKDNQLQCKTWNLKRIETHHGTGIGLESVRSILDYYYGGRYQLAIDDGPEAYQVNLSLEL